MKQLFVALVAVLSVAGLQTDAHAVMYQFLVDDFSDPALPVHTSADGVSRAMAPPGMLGSVAALGGGTDIASDRGLYGRPPMATGPFDPGALVAGSGDIDIALGPGEAAAIDWDVSGFDFGAVAPAIILSGLSNTGMASAMLSIALYQDGVLADTQVVTLASLETGDVLFHTSILGATTYVGFDIVNLSDDDPFLGVADQVVANPEPATMALIGLGVLGGAIGYRRRRKDDQVAPASAA